MPLAKQVRFKSFLPSVKLVGALIAASSLLAGCGGGGGSSSGGPSTRIFVAGDSLFDMGTYGFKFTVQSTTATTKIAIDHIAEAKGIEPPCPVYSPALALASSDCSGFAVGGASISQSAGTPLNIVKQLEDMKATYTSFGEGDLFLIDGGGNDFAALTRAFGAWARAAEAFAADPTNAALVAALQTATAGYATVLAPVISPTDYAANPAATVAAISAQVTSQTAALGLGAQYAVKLADMLMEAIDTNLIDSGAKRILISNPPNIVSTPNFATAAALAPVVSGWIGYYNIQLESLADARSEVEVYNTFAKFTELTTLASASGYGFTDVTSAACVPDLDTGLAAVQACSDVALTAQSIDWETYFFSDGFHGSPLANEVIATDMIGVINTLRW